ncbi:MAG TPA: DHHA1 domain-containing protein, partial [Thermoanaerobaculia bacterium]|nr:DHHA1 domain-containing protein [Thermoanaerobaculia bacterium]
IEAVTGRGALDTVRERERLAARLEAALGVPVERAAEELAARDGRLREAERELARLRRQLVTGGGGEAEAREVAGVRVLAREVPPAPAGELRDMADALRQRLGSGVVLLGSRGEGKVSLVAAVSDDLTGRVHAGELVREVAGVVGGGGGGRPDFAQAGGRLPEKLDEALARAYEAVAGQLQAGVG